MRFTEDERKTLKIAAAGRPLAAYIRWLIFKEEIPPARTRGNKPIKDYIKIESTDLIIHQQALATL